MIYYLLKTLISALLIVLISEFSKRSTFIGALLASIPTVSLLAFIWIYHDTKDIKIISELSIDIFWLVIPSLLLFLILPFLLKKGISFYVSLLISITLTSLAYTIVIFAKKKFLTMF